VPVIDVLYPTWNRRKFTRFSLQMLLDNTDWSLVRKLVIHDDGSDEQEGTVKLVRDLTRDAPVEVDIFARPWADRFGSPPAVMNWYLDNYGDSDFFAKIDSDIVVPPGWLEACLGVIDRIKHIDLLGFEAGRSGPPGHNGAPWDWDRPTEGYSFEAGSHIGGVGLMRTSVFSKHPAMGTKQGRYGFTEWQQEYRPVRGWITPDLLVSELSRIPFEPWLSITAEYVERDWEREWPKYHPRWDYWWSWWPK